MPNSTARAAAALSSAWISGGQRPGHAAGQPEDGVDGLARDLPDQLAELLADADHLLADLEPHLADDPEDVAIGLRSRRADDEVGPAEEEEVQRVVLDHEDAVDELPDLLGRRRRIDAVEVVQRLRRGHVVGRRAHAADAGRDLRHVLRAASLDELLEPAELRDLQERAVDGPGIVQEDVDLPVALEPRDRVDQDLACSSLGASSWLAGKTRLCSSEEGRL